MNVLEAIVFSILFQIASINFLVQYNFQRNSEQNKRSEPSAYILLRCCIYCRHCLYLGLLSSPGESCELDQGRNEPAVQIGPLPPSSANVIRLSARPLPPWGVVRPLPLPSVTGQSGSSPRGHEYCPGCVSGWDNFAKI